MEAYQLAPKALQACADVAADMQPMFRHPWETPNRIGPKLPLQAPPPPPPHTHHHPHHPPTHRGQPTHIDALGDPASSPGNGAIHARVPGGAPVAPGGDADLQNVRQGSAWQLCKVPIRQPATAPLPVGDPIVRQPCFGRIVYNTCSSKFRFKTAGWKVAHRANWGGQKRQSTDADHPRSRPALPLFRPPPEGRWRWSCPSRTEARRCKQADARRRRQRVIQGQAQLGKPCSARPLPALSQPARCHPAECAECAARAPVSLAGVFVGLDLACRVGIRVGAGHSGWVVASRAWGRPRQLRDPPTHRHLRPCAPHPLLFRCMAVWRLKLWQGKHLPAQSWLSRLVLLKCHWHTALLSSLRGACRAMQRGQRGDTSIRACLVSPLRILSVHRQQPSAGAKHT